MPSFTAVLLLRVAKMTYIFLRSASDFELNAISMLSKDIWGCVFIQTGIKGCYIWVDLNVMFPESQFYALASPKKPTVHLECKYIKKTPTALFC